MVGDPVVPAVGATLGVAILCLLTVGLRSWRRTAPLRFGRSLPEGSGASSSATSMTTHLAAASGVAVCGVSLLSGALGDGGIARGPTLVVAAVGGVIALSGMWGRVSSVRAGPDGLLVNFAGKRDFRAPWAEVAQLRPPHTPLGGWRVMTSRGSQTLMPSDLLGHEDALGIIVRRAALVFDGRHWTAEGGGGSV